MFNQGGAFSLGNSIVMQKGRANKKKKASNMEKLDRPYGADGLWFVKVGRSARQRRTVRRKGMTDSDGRRATGTGRAQQG